MACAYFAVRYLARAKTARKHHGSRRSLFASPSGVATAPHTAADLHHRLSGTSVIGLPFDSQRKAPPAAPTLRRGDAPNVCPPTTPHLPPPQPLGRTLENSLAPVRSPLIPADCARHFSAPSAAAKVGALPGNLAGALPMRADNVPVGKPVDVFRCPLMCVKVAPMSHQRLPVQRLGRNLLNG